MNFLRPKDLDPIPKRANKSQSEANGWDVVFLSFRLLFARLDFWIRLNFWSVLFSLPIITLPGAKAALYESVAAGLRDPGGSDVIPLKNMQAGFKKFFWKSLILAFLNDAIFLLTIISAYFWLVENDGLLRFVSIASFYFLILWWISSGYSYPILVENPEKTIFWIVKKAFLLGF